MEDLVCGICHEEWFTEIGEINSCTGHRFCFNCISKWAAIESKCPMCKERFTKITRKRLASPNKLKLADFLNDLLPGDFISEHLIEERDQRVIFEDPSFQEWINGLSCIVCGGTENEDQLLLCDGMFF